MSIGIKAVSMHYPDDYVDNISQAKVFDSTEDFIINKIGMERLSRKDKLDDTTDLAKRAVDLLSTNEGFSIQDIECLVLIHKIQTLKEYPILRLFCIVSLH